MFSEVIAAVLLQRSAITSILAAVAFCSDTAKDEKDLFWLTKYDGI
jgi:hypothetical protein